METTRSIMIVAGEPSGDRHAAKLVEEIREYAPERHWDFFGAAGPMMRRVGVEPVVAAGAPHGIGAMHAAHAAAQVAYAAVCERLAWGQYGGLSHHTGAFHFAL